MCHQPQGLQPPEGLKQQGEKWINYIIGSSAVLFYFSVPLYNQIHHHFQLELIQFKKGKVSEWLNMSKEKNSVFHYFVEWKKDPLIL